MEAGLARFLFKAAARGRNELLAGAQLAARLRSQAQKRERNARKGLIVPPVMIMSVTRRCNLACAGCYSAALRPEACAEMEDGRFLEIAREAVDLGVSSFIIAGGEPFLRPSLLRGLANIPGHASAVFTNGTLLRPDSMEIFSSGRISPVLSIEGDAALTGERRGRGIHERAMATAELLRAMGVPFGFSVTLTSRNASMVLADAFLGNLARLGTGALFIIEYVPVQAGTESLAIGPEDRARLLSAERFARLPYPVATLPGDEEAYGGCLAAGRGFIHLNDQGALEPCPFAPFSDSSAASGSLAQALASPLMARIRERHAELTETSGGCALWNKRGWVASLASCGARRAGSTAAA
jgi:MoaA/NifB/PqqE/SkfB family radical SAM enzyme